VSAESKSERAYRLIRSRIDSGQYVPGYRLVLATIANELDMSVVPVREAIRRLEELGLVESSPNRGASVKDFTHEDLLDVYAVRRLLEAEAARLGAAAIDAAGVEDMRAEHAVLLAAIEDRRAVDYLDADERLLSVLYGAAGNPVLVETIQNLWHRCRSYKLVGVTTELETGDPAVLGAFQRDLITAAEAADPARASHLTEGSLDAAMARIRATLHD
jgi:DNA-binding GntR family transcriptional regulator